MALAPFSTRFAAEAMVCTVDALAAAAGAGALRAGGCAADAAIAAGAVLAVTHQHQCGLGGDLLALVHRDGDERPCALNASGRAGTGADPLRLREAGLHQMPATGDVGCVPVPGCVDGWLALHARFSRLPLEELLEPARRHAANGFAASEPLARAAQSLGGIRGAEDYAAVGGRAGQIVRRPGVARALAAIAREGRRGFYEGEFGRSLRELGGGEYSANDLAEAHADWVEPLGLDAFGGRLWSLPPNSQGYILLRAAALISALALPEPDDPAWAQLLIEATRASEADRDAVWHERFAGTSLIAPETIAPMLARVRGARTADRTAAALTGDTVSLCAVDSERMAVSLLQSNFIGWGSMLFLPGLGVALHNRGASFSLEPGHPAEYGPRRRPPHTLAPALLTAASGSLEAAVATRGGHIQPQILLQLLARVRGAGQMPGEAMAAGRWALAGDQVIVEGQATETWLDGLAARGHRVKRAAPFSEDFGQAQLILRRGDHLAGASDPRSSTWAAALL